MNLPEHAKISVIFLMFTLVFAKFAHQAFYKIIEKNRKLKTCTRDRSILFAFGSFFGEIAWLAACLYLIALSLNYAF